MIFGGTALALLSAWFILYWIFRRRLPGTPWFYRCAAVAGVISVFCIECGWTVTEVGRQPWIVYNFLRTADAVTTAGMVRPLFAIIVVIYTLIAIATVLTLRKMSRRWQAGDTLESPVPVPYGPVHVVSTTETPHVGAAAGSREEP
jgi:cytochrome d ubiquinol oxidase subunit I